MTKAQHAPRDLAQWLLSRDGDLANLAGRELERALDRAEKAEAVDDSCMDTAYLTGHKKGWNEAVEAALIELSEADSLELTMHGITPAMTRVLNLKKGNST